MKVMIRQWDTGDWVQVIVEDRMYYEGHSVPEFVFVELLRLGGVEVEEERVEEEIE